MKGAGAGPAPVKRRKFVSRRKRRRLVSLHEPTRIDLAVQEPADSSASQITFSLGFRSASEMALPSLITLVDLPTRRRTSPPVSSLTTNSFLAGLTDRTSPLTVFAAFWADEPSDEPDCPLAATASPREVKKRTREKANMNFFIHVYSLFLSISELRQKTTISFSALVQGERRDLLHSFFCPLSGG